jgi:hypothetical protein
MRRDQLAEHTATIDAAVTETRQLLDAARTALLDIAGGPEGITDINVLNLARAHARELDSPLARVEAAAARAFATAQADRNDRMVDVGAVPAASVV